MSTYSYLIAWLWYLAAVIGLMVVWWRMTRRLPPFWRDLSRALPTFWALMPWSVASGHGSLAPVWLVTLFEGLLRENGDVKRAGVGLLLATLIAVVVTAVEAWRRRAERAPEPVRERREPRVS